MLGAADPDYYQNFVIKYYIDVIDHEIKHLGHITWISPKSMMFQLSKRSSFHYVYQCNDETFFRSISIM